MSFTVYKHTAPNGKVYIGITGQQVNKRWQGGSGYYSNDHFSKAIKKYGWDNFKHEIICEDLTKDEACKKEIELIAMYDSRNPEKGYNKSTGGENCRIGAVHTEETKIKFSKARKGKKLTEEHKQKISKALKGKTLNKPRKSHEVSKETREKISTSKKGVPFTEEHKKKLRQASTTKKSVICVETGEVFKSIADAEREKHINGVGIIYVCNGKRKTAGGHTWKYINS